jgi:broad specificity phosphatase PhoE
MSVTLYLGRHGETRLNVQERLRAWIDEPLNKDGIAEAHAMADAMKKLPIDRIYASDLDRADHTAQIVAKEHGLKPILRQWFRPLNYGDLSGKAITEIQPELDRLNEEWKTNPDEEAPNGESFAEFQDRNLQGLHAIFSAAKDGEQIMLVAHLRNCLLFHGVAMTGGPLKGETMEQMEGKNWDQESGSVSKFIWDGTVFQYVGMVFEPEDSESEKAGVS